MKRAVLIVIFLVFSISAVLVMAESRDRRERGKKEADLFETLNLTPEQNTKIQGLREAYLVDQMKIRSQLIDTYTELRLLWMQRNVDPVKIREKQAQVHTLKKQRVDKRTDYQLAVRHILTPGQLSKYITEKYGSAREKYKGKRKIKGKRAYNR